MSTNDSQLKMSETFITDQKHRLSERKRLLHVTRKMIPSRIDDIDHHCPVRRFPFSCPKKTRAFLCVPGRLQQCGLPLLRKRNRRNNNPHAGIAVLFSESADCFQRKNRFPGSCRYMNNPTPVILFPGSEAFLLPGIKGDYSARSIMSCHSVLPFIPFLLIIFFIVTQYTPTHPTRTSRRTAR